MSRVIRPLLVAGNDKLSAGVFHFDIPAVLTCPGRSKLCVSRCYARRGRFAFPQVQERLAWNYAQSKRADFVELMADELYRKGILLCRWHVAGDIYSPTYARKMLEVIGRSPHCTFWFYTRSWRVPTIFPLIRAIAVMPNVRVWLSGDSETGYPPEVPDGCRVAWMQTEVGEDTENADLVFLDRPLRRLALPLLDKVCPTETPLGKERGTSCATCRLCWTG
ncbi:GP88 family protein [Limnoglobus roseus]|uniref:Gene product 88 domain-containing protein n=1 Tax=Limnoglobus roseus TaxID=2598579 RepID=A0A5C1AHV3_9BACT|nr:hypothetical protein [Limnoglobus roseus]QEL18771.1 hypothetical protein PX52LOC_05809 [Limnoglobus roseus]